MRFYVFFDFILFFKTNPLILQILWKRGVVLPFSHCVQKEETVLAWALWSEAFQKKGCV